MTYDFNMIKPLKILISGHILISLAVTPELATDVLPSGRLMVSFRFRFGASSDDHGTIYNKIKSRKRIT